VAQFDPEAEGVQCERRWTVTFLADPSLATPPDAFTFGTAKIEAKADERFRYVDADLVAAEPSVSLERSYGKAKRPWLWIAPMVAVFGFAAFLGLRRMPRTAAVEARRFQVPEPLTPFSVIGLLERVGRENGLAQSQHTELQDDISALEKYYFGDPLPQAPDLRGIAERWVSRAR
jgi:hypothetical protein